nr:hypothetical protein [Neobittarella massiliensis]
MAKSEAIKKSITSAMRYKKSTATPMGSCCISPVDRCSTVSSTLSSVKVHLAELAIRISNTAGKILTAPPRIVPSNRSQPILHGLVGSTPTTRNTSATNGMSATCSAEKRREQNERYTAGQCADEGPQAPFHLPLAEKSGAAALPGAGFLAFLAQRTRKIDRTRQKSKR